MKKAAFAALLCFVILTPTLAFAAGAVPTTPLVPKAEQQNTMGKDFTLCDLRQLAQNIINYAVYLSVFVATLMFAYGGILYVTAASGGEAQIKKAHGVLSSTFIGIVLVLIAWLLVNIVLSVLTGESINQWTNWFGSDPRQCAAPESSPLATSGGSVQGQSAGSNYVGPAGSCVAASQAAAGQYGSSANCDPASRVVNYGSGTSVVNSIKNKYGSVINQCASQQKIPSNVLVAIAGIECGMTGVQNGTCGDPTGVGHGISGVSVPEVKTYCAQSNDPSCNGYSSLSSSQQASLIDSNQQLSFCATAYTMKQDYSQYGDWGLAADAYNGGSASLAPSKSCPGFLVLQCPIASTNSANPYCTTTCAYNDAFGNYLASSGGTTGMNFEQNFRTYMALAEAILKKP